MKKVLLLVLLIPCFCTAQLTVKEAYEGALTFLVNSQTDSTIKGVQYKGEWPVYMELTEPFFFIGRRQRARDSNCFTVSAIHNLLAEIYVNDTSQKQLLPVLDAAFEEVLSYQTNTEFNFWKNLAPPKDHKRRPGKHQLPLVRRPTNFSFKPRLVMKMANVPNDADDTNQGNLAVWYHNQITGDTLELASAQKFEEWVDLKRQNRNWYNYLLHTRKNSGAYLTWLDQEYNYGFWNPLYGYLSVLSIFLPTSSAYPKAYEPWIPFGANDVCPIVNANILTYLAESGQLEEAQSVTSSVEVITRMTRKDLWHTAGVYYPNAQHLSYSIAKAYASGVTQLQEAASNTLRYLSTSQTENGAYVSKPWVNYRDSVQTTTYALSALLNLKEAGMAVDDSLILKSLDFLLKKAQEGDKGISWKGGIYFTGGTALRNILHWDSDAYTTALIAEALQKIVHDEIFVENFAIPDN
ncbi:hypothetical protein [Jiulongibacter sp. NS-SX5]|uniref:hypothetical protein n=1 Tax=Jiulongibacter sp. NS-SX5 TaxID=3463854 RepID=UPI0040589B4F